MHARLSIFPLGILGNAAAVRMICG